MPQWHLDELRGALESKGWRFIGQLPGDDYRISATWEFRRSRDPRVLLIDFEGLADMRVLPLHESYACRVRGTDYSLYFRRRGDTGSVARQRWRDELSAFVGAINGQIAV